jgi:hypothetical protein
MAKVKVSERQYCFLLSIIDYLDEPDPDCSPYEIRLYLKEILNALPKSARSLTHEEFGITVYQKYWEGVEEWYYTEAVQYICEEITT